MERSLEIAEELEEFINQTNQAIAINPVTSSIFGKDGMSDIQIPVIIVSSSDDKNAPALPEQIQPFTWLNNPEKSLVLLECVTHFSTLDQTNLEVRAKLKI